MAATALQGKTDVMGRDGFTWWVGEVEDKEDPQEIGRAVSYTHLTLPTKA